MQSSLDLLTEFELLTVNQVAMQNGHEQPDDKDFEIAKQITDRCNKNRIKIGLEIFN